MSGPVDYTTIAAGIVDGTWMQRAACAGMPADLFYPSGGNEFEARGGSNLYPPAARAACASCPVAAECLVHAVIDGERHGMWGGLSPEERRPIRRQLMALGIVKPVETAAVCGTPSGYKAHRRLHTTICDACRSAHSARVAARRAEVRAAAREQSGVAV